MLSCLNQLDLGFLSYLTATKQRSVKSKLISHLIFRFVPALSRYFLSQQPPPGEGGGTQPCPGAGARSQETGTGLKSRRPEPVRPSELGGLLVVTQPGGF